MDHVGIVVDELAAAPEFFVELGLELPKFHTPSSQDDNRHAPANTPAVRHVAFAVADIDAGVADLRAGSAELVGELERYEDSYWLCSVPGPRGLWSTWRSRSAHGPSRPTCGQPE